MVVLVPSVRDVLAKVNVKRKLLECLLVAGQSVF